MTVDPDGWTPEERERIRVRLILLHSYMRAVPTLWHVVAASG